MPHYLAHAGLNPGEDVDMCNPNGTLQKPDHKAELNGTFKWGVSRFYSFTYRCPQTSFGEQKCPLQLI